MSRRPSQAGHVASRVRPVLGLVLFALGQGCGSGGDTQKGTFTVDFPTTAAAIAVVKSTPGVQVSVYATSALDAGGVGGACQSLIEQSLTNVLTAVPVATTSPLSPCDLEAGQGSLPVGFGSYAFLAVAQSSPGQDFLVGCAEQTLSSSNTVVTIPLTLAGDQMSVPSTTCTTLSAACPSGGGC